MPQVERSRERSYEVKCGSEVLRFEWAIVVFCLSMLTCRSALVLWEGLREVDVEEIKLGVSAAEACGAAKLHDVVGPGLHSIYIYRLE